MADNDDTRLTVRLTADDQRRLRWLMADTGIRNMSDLVRQALADMFKARGLDLAEAGLEQYRNEAGAT